jgi:ankyrin repeat protein
MQHGLAPLHSAAGSLLYNAAGRGPVAAVKALVEAGADVNATGNVGGTVMCSVDKKCKNTLKYAKMTDN